LAVTTLPDALQILSGIGWVVLLNGSTQSSSRQRYEPGYFEFFARNTLDDLAAYSHMTAGFMVLATTMLRDTYYEDKIHPVYGFSLLVMAIIPFRMA
jgi:hypothetical protein